MLKLNVNFCTRLRKWEKTRPKAQHQIIAFEEGAAKVSENVFEVFEAHVLTNPEPLALVKHGGVGGITVHTVGAPWSNDANLGH